MNLEDRYAKMETKELVKIISLNKEQYTPEAINAAKVELRKRGESKETLVPLLTEAKEEKKAIAEKPLSGRERLFFTLLPWIVFWLGPIILASMPSDWKRRKLEAKLCQYRGWLAYFSIALMVIIVEILKHGFPIWVGFVGLFTLEGVAFIAFIFAHQRTKKKLADLAGAK